MYGGRLTPHPPAQSATCGRSNLKGLLYVVCFGELVFGDGLTGGDAWEAEASQFVVIRYLSPPYHVV